MLEKILCLFPEEQITPPRDYYSDIFCSLRSFNILQVSGHSSNPMPNHGIAGKTKQKQTRRQRTKILNLHKKQVDKKVCIRFLAKIVSQNLIRREQKGKSICIGHSTKQLAQAPHNCQCHKKLKKKKNQGKF